MGSTHYKESGAGALVAMICRRPPERLERTCGASHVECSQFSEPDEGLTPRVHLLGWEATENAEMIIYKVQVPASAIPDTGSASSSVRPATIKLSTSIASPLLVPSLSYCRLRKALISCREI